MPAASGGRAVASKDERDLVAGARDHEQVVGACEQRAHVALARVAAGHLLPRRDARDARVVVADGSRPSGVTSAEKPRQRRSAATGSRRVSGRRRTSGLTRRPGSGPSRSACSSRCAPRGVPGGSLPRRSTITVCGRPTGMPMSSIDRPPARRDASWTCERRRRQRQAALAARRRCRPRTRSRSSPVISSTLVAGAAPRSSVSVCGAA